jgi:hypothetical protein
LKSPDGLPQYLRNRRIRHRTGLIERGHQRHRRLHWVETQRIQARHRGHWGWQKLFGGPVIGTSKIFGIGRSPQIMRQPRQFRHEDSTTAVNTSHGAWCDLTSTAGPRIGAGDGGVLLAPGQDVISSAPAKPSMAI